MEVESDQPVYCMLVNFLPVSNEDAVHMRDPCREHCRWMKEEGFKVFPEECIMITPGEWRQKMV